MCRLRVSGAQQLAHWDFAGCCGGRLTVFAVHTPPSSGRPQPAPFCFRAREPQVPCSAWCPAPSSLVLPTPVLSEVPSLAWTPAREKDPCSGCWFLSFSHRPVAPTPTSKLPPPKRAFLTAHADALAVIPKFVDVSVPGLNLTGIGAAMQDLLRRHLPTISGFVCRERFRKKVEDVLNRALQQHQMASPCGEEQEEKFRCKVWLWRNLRPLLHSRSGVGHLSTNCCRLGSICRLLATLSAEDWRAPFRFGCLGLPAPDSLK